MKPLIYIALFISLYIIFSQIIDGYITEQDPLLTELQSQLSVLHPRFQNLKLYEGRKSYTLNKNRIYICLKDRDGRYYNRNMLVYVICHEYAHLLCPEVDSTENHGELFFKIFDEILYDAEKRGLYNSKIPILLDYCGHS